MCDKTRFFQKKSANFSFTEPNFHQHCMVKLDFASMQCESKYIDDVRVQYHLPSGQKYRKRFGKSLGKMLIPMKMKQF